MKNIKHLSVLLFIIASSFGLSNISSAAQDRFGITELYESAPGGRQWFSKWDNGNVRAWTSPINYDPDDPELFTKGSQGSYGVGTDGIIKVSGSDPRLYVIDPPQRGIWRDVEITTYGKRVSDSNIGPAGIQAFARINHLWTGNRCDTRGYAGRFRNDGYVSFMKETVHGGDYPEEGRKLQWSGGLPKNVWIGYKYIVYDLPDGNVKLELWLDETDGLNGGNWKKVTEFIDNGIIYSR